jgi:hypothetical protein
MAGMSFVLVLLAAWIVLNGAVLVVAVGVDRAARNGPGRPAGAAGPAAAIVPFAGR